MYYAIGRKARKHEIPNLTRRWQTKGDTRTIILVCEPNDSGVYTDKYYIILCTEIRRIA